MSSPEGDDEDERDIDSEPRIDRDEPELRIDSELEFRVSSVLVPDAVSSELLPPICSRRRW
jgi:hypothetical protein